MIYRTFHISSTGSYSVSGGNSELGTVNINTGAGSAVLTLYDALSAVGGTEIAVIDASTKSSHAYIVYCKVGMFAVLSGGNADISIGHQ